MTKQQYYDLLNREVTKPIKNSYQNRLAKFQEENSQQKRILATGWYNQLPEVNYGR